MPCALIVDDEPDILELIGITLRRMGIEARAAKNLTEARHLLATHSFDICLTDMRLPDGNGIELITHIQSNHPQLPVAMITAHGNMDTAIKALRAGAFDFINKPVDMPTLREMVTSALRLTGKEQPERTSEPELLGESAAMESIRQMIHKLARSQAPIYISGESGTGKERVARLIHAQGPRAALPFIAINCGAIPSELMESEFFGHKKGSFSGAVSNKEGLFQAAHSGTLFLDEVADLPLHMQVKLLRAIQEKTIRPVGAQQEMHVDVRILSATHKDLVERVQKGTFREDLLFRINVIELHIPPLRERAEDIPILATHILERLAQQMERPAPTLDKAALSALQGYPFPGNVRELENALERALTLCEGESIGRDDLLLPSHREDGFHTASAVADGGHGKQSLEDYLEAIERELINKALEENNQNRTVAAKALGISFRSLRYRLQKLGLD